MGINKSSDLSPTPGDNIELPHLTERQEMVLSLIVREYTRNPQPVASKALVEQFNLGISSATVRNEMSALEQYGLIYAPHTSAGRVPTKLGYRYFVNRLLNADELPSLERRRIAREFQRAPQSVEEWMRLAASVLSRTSQYAALVTLPRAAENHFRHLELISTQGRLVLLVLVLQGGSVHQQVLTLADVVQQDTLSRLAQIINETCAGLTAEQVRSKTRSMSDTLAREVGDLVADAMIQTNQQSARDVVRYGLSESLYTLTDDEAQQAVRVLEEQSVLSGILREMMGPDQPDVRVVVAGEERWNDLSHLSMVLARYGTPSARGALGVLGPTRMRYGRAISAVRYVASLMSGMMGNVYEESRPDEDQGEEDSDS